MTTGDLVKEAGHCCGSIPPPRPPAPAPRAPPREPGVRRLPPAVGQSRGAAKRYAEIARTHKAPIAIDWSAPRDGIVLERNAIEGMKAAAGDAVQGRGSVVWALVDVSERDLGGSSRANRDVRARGLPGEISPAASADLSQVNGRPAPFGCASNSPILNSHCSRTCMSTPRSRRRRRGGDRRPRQRHHRHRHTANGDRGQGRRPLRAARRSRLGRRGDGYVEIARASREGDEVVIAANFLIDAESNLKAALKGFSASRRQANDRARHRAGRRATSFLVFIGTASSLSRRASMRCARCRSTRFPISPTCR